MNQARSIPSFTAPSDGGGGGCTKELPPGLGLGGAVMVDNQAYRLPTEKVQLAHDWYLWQPPREALWIIKEDLARDLEKEGHPLVGGFDWVSIDPAHALEKQFAARQAAEDTELASKLYAEMVREVGAGGRPETIMVLSAAAERLSKGE